MQAQAAQAAQARSAVNTVVCRRGICRMAAEKHGYRMAPSACER